MFARAVDSDETIQNALKNVVFVQMDCEKGEGPAVAEKYGVHAYPTFKMVNFKGEETDGWIGYPGPDRFAQFVTAGVKDPRTVAEKKAAFDQAPTAALAAALANHAATSFDFAASVKYYRKARDLDPAQSAFYTGEILTNMYYGMREETFATEELDSEGQLVLNNPDATADQIVQAAQMVGGALKDAGQPELAIPYIKAGLAATEGDTDMERVRKNLEIDAALLIDKDADKAVALKKSSLPDGWQDDPNRLNSFAWWCYENDINLAEAEEMALRGVELASDDSQRANILDTAAEICAARGDCSEAIVRIKRAIALDPEKEYFKEQLAKFEKQLAEKKG